MLFSDDHEEFPSNWAFAAGCSMRLSPVRLRCQTLRSPEFVEQLVDAGRIGRGFKPRSSHGRWRGLISPASRLLERSSCPAAWVLAHSSEHLHHGPPRRAQSAGFVSGGGPGIAEGFYREARLPLDSTIPISSVPTISITKTICTSSPSNSSMAAICTILFAAMARRRRCELPTTSARPLGLGHAHEAKGWYTATSNPANMLLDRTGCGELLDMGLARFFDEGSKRSSRNSGRRLRHCTADYLALSK